MISSNKTDIDTLLRVKKLSGWLKRLTELGILLFIGFSLSVLIVPEWFDNMVAHSYPDLPLATQITFLKRVCLISLYLIPLGIALYGLWNVRLLFECYGQGEVFSIRPGNYIHKVGLAKVIHVATSVLVHSLGSVLLTFDNPAGNKQLTVSLSSNIYLLLLMGGLLIVIGWVMQEASRISDENRQFI